MRACAVVLAAGSSRRLGEPKQLLPYRNATLLDASLDVARAAPVQQRLVTLGGAADAIRSTVDLDGFDVVDAAGFSDGCSSSIVSALEQVQPTCDGLVLLLGDQPHVSPATVEQLLGAVDATRAEVAVCSYDDGIGHPFWFRRSTFAELANLHGDKAVWKVIESGRHDVQVVEIPGPIPADVDTREDYEALLSHDSNTADR